MSLPFADLTAAYAWLDGHINLERKLAEVRYDPASFGLEAFRRRLDALGNPQRGLRTIHIAGTRGKGSAALMLEALLERSGLRTAVYTSPHLREYRERIRVDGRTIAPEPFLRAIAPLAELGTRPDDAPHPTGFKTVFENLTALYFLAARGASVDWAIVETGLGGRLDATNVLDAGPVLLTRIGLEHTALLGPTREAIAGEKAAILKPGGFAVASAQAPAEPGDGGAAGVFEARARQTGAPLAWAPELCPLLESHLHPEGQRLVFRFEGEPLTLDLPLYGAFLAENIQNALAMVAVLRADGRIPRAPRAALAAALAGLRLPGRMERVASRPDVFADGAHCPTGGAALAASMRAHFGEEPADLILGMLSEKDHAGFLTAVAAWPGWRRVICYRAPSTRAADPALLAELARRHFDDVVLCPTLANALEFLPGVVEKQHRAVASGTLYSVAAVEDWGRGRVRVHADTTTATTPPDQGANPGDS